MYHAHFGLREPPFSLTPDTSFFFACSSYQEALNTLLVAAKNGEGFIKITGEVGNGKTLLCRKFIATLGPSFVAAYLPNPYLEPKSLLLALADEFNVAIDRGADQHLVLKAITHALLNFARAGKRVVVCLDEAQAMPLESLEVLRLLTNLETEKRKLMQVVLFGQPELNERLKEQSVRQLRQRISFQHQLGGLRKDEVDLYLSHRLNVAGYQGGRLFGKSAVKLLHRFSGGTPRLINILAHKALMLVFGEGGQQVLPRHVQTAANDTPAVRGPLLLRWVWVGLTMLIVSGGLGWVLMQ
ncbi:MAG: AAA family ATPase [Betaproteobacteria bacterium]|nr:AAA family ATPase [Betaproteobacteria bacterium]